MDTVPVFKVTAHDLIIIKSLGGSPRGLGHEYKNKAADTANAVIHRMMTS